MSNGEIFSDIADRYDRVNRILSFGRDQVWRRTAIRRLPMGRILDLGAGTGAANPAFGNRRIVALDPSPEMLALNGAGEKIVGVGEELPFPDGSFDAVFSAYVFRNLDSVGRTLDEIARVLRPGGRAGIVDLARPRAKAAAALHRAGSRLFVPLVGRLVGAPGEYRYLDESLDSLPPPEDMYRDASMPVVDLWRMGPLGFVYGVVLERR